MPFLDITTSKIYYEVHGDGETVVLLHHGFGCTEMWEKIWPALVENGYRVIMYDRRGYGRSERGKDFKEFYVSGRFRSESVNDLNQLMDFLQVSSFHLIGQCEGGVIAIDYAVKFPERVRTIVTSSTQCFSKIPMSEFHKIKDTNVFQELESDLKQKLMEWHGKDRAEAFYNHQFRRYGGAYGKDVFDLRGLLPQVICSVLVLYPDRSFFFDVEQGVAFYRHLPYGELAVLPKCGHSTYEHQPEEYIRHVVNFLKRYQH
ncbi:MAG: alpha/beta hydrolase [Deltaproteobacteria bacterium]|nr:alpha/beta hydrolase [Deltaproteobacteria bacterium]MBW2642382.1 alpha/beta hydrolase [Deltaproteobacteria bacterium]